MLGPAVCRLRSPKRTRWLRAAGLASLHATLPCTSCHLPAASSVPHCQVVFSSAQLTPAAAPKTRAPTLPDRPLAPATSRDSRTKAKQRVGKRSAGHRCSSSQAATVLPAIAGLKLTLSRHDCSLYAPASREREKRAQQGGRRFAGASRDCQAASGHRGPRRALRESQFIVGVL